MVQEAIEALLRQKLGLDAQSIGSGTIARVIGKRQQACGCKDPSAYLAHLQASPQELDHLIEAIVVPETWFFRDKEPFIYLKSYVANEWRKANPEKVFHALSAPCSTGEEAYSIAITLLEAGLKPAQIRIDAVDISKVALRKAEQAIYRKNSFRGSGFRNQQRYFQKVDNGCAVRPFVRETVRFKQGNLLEPRFLPRNSYHTIFCRNLLIYLDRDSRTRLVQTLDQALSLEGLLFVGAVETSQITAKHYIPVRHPSAFVYRKSNPEGSAPPAIAPPVAKPAPAKPPPQIAPITQRAATPAPASQLETAKQLADRGQLLQAMQLCETYLRAHRTDAQAYLLLGEIYQGLDQAEAAEQCFRQALYLNPNEYEALIHLALLKEQRGDRTSSENLKKRAQRLLNSPI